MATEILGFVCEWYDPQPMKTRKFLTKVFVEDKQIEIYDTALNKRFLSKSPLPRDVSPKDFFVGSKVLIHARLFTVVDYADPYTRRKLGPASEGTTLLIGPDAYYDTGKILEGLTGGTGLKVTKLQSFALNEPELQDLLPLLGGGERGAVPYEQRVKFWCSGQCVAVELAGPDARGAVAALAPQLRQRFAANDLEAAVWHADGLGDFFFGPARRFAHTATLTAGAVTCALVRPHAVKAGSLPGILDAILSSRSFTVTAMKMCALAKADAAEFLEVYDGVMPTHKDMLVELCTGPAVALEVTFSGQQRDRGPGGVVAAFRDFVGPWDVEMAKELRPDTIRARHGVDRTKNAIHATDLPEDGASECGYLFDFLQ